MLSPDEIKMIQAFPSSVGDPIGGHRHMTAELEILRLRKVPLKWIKDHTSRELVAVLFDPNDAPMLEALRAEIAAWRAANP